MHGIVHAGPALGAAFTQYTAEFEAGGELGGTAAQRFPLRARRERSSRSRGQERRELVAARLRLFAAGLGASRRGDASKPRRGHREAVSAARSRVKPPGVIVSSEDAVDSHALGDDPDLQVKCLLPDAMSFDFAVNTMVYQPGAALSMVEMHVMEHGLLMLEGGGIYRLGDSWYPVTAGDFIWMGPWCPQWFGAIGKSAREIFDL